MRREYFKSQQSYLDWLKSKGCRFYAPMDEEHGTSELIQGWTFNIRSGCTCVYDSNVQAYLITGNSSSQLAAMWTGKSIQPHNIGKRAVETSYTVIVDFNLTNAPGWSSPFTYGGSDNFNVNASGTSSSRNVLSSIYREFYTRNGRTCSLNNWYTYADYRNLYDVKRNDINTNGIDVMETEHSEGWGFVYNNNVDTHVGLMIGCSGYMRDLYIFDTALSDGDLMTIYHHDHV